MRSIKFIMRTSLGRRFPLSSTGPAEETDYRPDRIFGLVPAGGRGSLPRMDEVERQLLAYRDDEAIEILQQCIDDASAASALTGDGGPEPWYFVEASIVLERLGRTAAELAVLDRYLSTVDAQNASVLVVQRRNAALKRLHAPPESFG